MRNTKPQDINESPYAHLHKLSTLEITTRILCVISVIFALGYIAKLFIDFVLPLCK